MVARIIRTLLNWLAVVVVVTGTAFLVFGVTDEPHWRGGHVLVAGLPFALALYATTSRAGVISQVGAALVNAFFAALSVWFGAAASLNIGGIAVFVPFLALGAGLCAWNAAALVRLVLAMGADRPLL